MQQDRKLSEPEQKLLDGIMGIVEVRISSKLDSPLMVIVWAAIKELLMEYAAEFIDKLDTSDDVSE